MINENYLTYNTNSDKILFFKDPNVVPLFYFLKPEFDNCDIIVYEEVKRMIPFPRKILVLVGSQGVGRRALKEKLIREEPTKYAAAMPRMYFIVLGRKRFI